MKVLDIVKQLIAQGYSVDYYVRKDGGILIRSIDGQKFTGAQGNTMARKMVGATLSTARAKQLSWNVQKLIKGVKKPKTKLETDIESELKKTQRLWRKTKSKGRITKKKVREKIELYGRDETLNYLKRAQRYAQGYAYTENVLYLVDRLKGLIRKYPKFSNQFNELINHILSIQNEFLEKWIEGCNDVIYKCEEGAILPQDCIKDIYKIIKNASAN